MRELSVKRNIIPITIISLLLLAFCIITLMCKIAVEEIPYSSTAFDELYNFHTAVVYELMLIVYSFIPVIYGIAIALLVFLNFKSKTVSKFYSLFAIIAFSLVATGMCIATIAYYGFSLIVVQPWMFASWAMTGMLFPFFISSVLQFKKKLVIQCREIERSMSAKN